MKKYCPHFPCYGQSVAGRIAYYEKMGVAQGIITMLKSEARDRNLNLDKWETKETYNGVELTFFGMTIVIPTPNDRMELFEYPTFKYNGVRGYIDMIHVDSSELQFHLMVFDRGEDNFRKGKTKEFINKHWHTVRECLSLEDTCTLFEYIEDRLKELIILPPDETDKYNHTGALGVGI